MIVRNQTFDLSHAVFSLLSMTLWLKAHLHWFKACSFDELFNSVGQSCDLFPPE